MTIDCTSYMPVLCSALFHNMGEKYMKGEKKLFHLIFCEFKLGGKHVFAYQLCRNNNDDILYFKNYSFLIF